MDTNTADPDIDQDETGSEDQADESSDQSSQPSSQSGDRLDPDKIKNAKEKFNKIRGNNKSPNQSSTNTGSSTPGGKPQNSGHFNKQTPGGSTQQSGGNASLPGSKTPGQSAAQSGTEQAGKQAMQAGKAAGKATGKAADTATNDQEADLAGKAAGKATGAGVGAATGNKELGRKVGEGVEDTTKGGIAAGEAIASGGADVEADKELLKLAWKYKRVLIRVIAIILIFFVALFFIMFADEQQGWANDAQQNPVSVTKKGEPATISNGGTITYTISVSSPSPAEVTDQIPSGTQLIPGSQSTGVTCDTDPCGVTSRIIKWSSVTANITPPINASFSYQVKALPSANNSWVLNIARGTALSANITGDAKSLAQQILNNPNIILANSSRQDIQTVVDGTYIQTAANTGSCGNKVTIHPELLKTMVYLGQRHTYTVWNIVTGHACDQYNHPKGKGMDIGTADGVGAWKNYSFRQDAADILPEGGIILQTSCPGTPAINTHGKRLLQGPDGCNHQHIDVGYDVANVNPQ